MRSNASTLAEYHLQANLLDTHPVLVVPGWNGSGEGHWQTIWEQQHSSFQRVEQANWTDPAKDEWIECLHNEIQEMDRPGFIVAHSLGCLAVAHWAAQATRAEAEPIAGAFLVAPPWLSQAGCWPSELHDFLPMPLIPLPFPAMLVASENDPYLPMANATELAACWRSEFVNVGRQGHINIASGHGSWKHGKTLLTAFIVQATGVAKREAMIGITLGSPTRRCH